MLREAMKPLERYSCGYPKRSDELQTVRNHSRAILRALRTATESPEESLQAKARQALDRLGLAEANQSLREQKQTDGPKARAEAVRWLSNPLIAWRYTPVLLHRLKDEDAGVRAAAAEMLGKMVAEADRAVPALVAALDDADLKVRETAAHSLGQMGEEAAAAIPALLVAVKCKENGSLRGDCAYALGRIGRGKPDLVLPALLEALRDKPARAGAALGIYYLGPAAEQAVVPLVNIVKEPISKDPNDGDLTFEFALLALSSIGPKAKAAVPALLELFLESEQQEGVRKRVHFVLCQIGPAADAAVPRAGASKLGICHDF